MDYSVYLTQPFFFVFLQVILLLVTTYSIGSEGKFHTSANWLAVADGNIWVAVTAKLLPYSFIFIVMSILANYVFFGAMHIPMDCGFWALNLTSALLVIATQALAVFLFSLFPALSIIISIVSMVGSLGATLGGVTPSSLSRNVVTGLLKDELGFKGLVFTDALDMKGVSAIPQVTTKALLAGNDMVLVQFNTKNAVQELVDAVESGQLSKDELDAKCRKVLMYKYMLGLRNRQPQLRVSGMSYRINTEEAQALAAKLRRSAVTVLNNYFDVLPLAPVEGDIAVLSIGEKEADAPFVEAMKKNAGISHFHLPWNADEALWQEVQGQLAAFRRVVISITGSTYVSDRDVAFLEGLNLRAPLVYTFFTSYRTLQPLMPALAKSSAVVLAHSAETDLQQYVADVLFAKKPASGRMSMSIGKLFPAGTGCMIEPGTCYQNRFG
jgi:hypothetical protein